MLLEYIERARNQPKEVKQRLVWVWSIALTGFIVLIWLSVLLGRHYAERGGISNEDVRTPESVEADTASRFNAANDFLNNSAPAVFTGETVRTQKESSGTSTSTTTRSGVPQETATPTPPLWP